VPVLTEPVEQDRVPRRCRLVVVDVHLVGHRARMYAGWRRESSLWPVAASSNAVLTAGNAATAR
jgi:hypothetical protein